MEGTITFRDGVPAVGQFALSRAGTSKWVAVTSDATGRFAIPKIECGKYRVTGVLLDGTAFPTVEINGRSPVVITIAGPSWTFSTGANTTIAEDEALADEMRREFLQRISPEDWFVCYQKEPDGQRRTDLFGRVVHILWMDATNTHIPPEAYVNCNTPRGGVVKKTVVSALRQGLTVALQRVLARLTPPELVFLARRLTPTGTDPLDQTPSADENERQVVIGRQTALSLVREFGDDEAASFLNDPPRLQALKLVRATGNLMVRRPWPSPWLVFTAEAGGGEAWRIVLTQFYRTETHPDINAWRRMSLRQRGEAIRRMYAETFHLAALTAAGEMRLADLASTFGLKLSDGEREKLIRSAFGSQGLEQYRAAVASNDADSAPGYRAEDLAVGAYMYYFALSYAALIAL